MNMRNILILVVVLLIAGAVLWMVRKPVSYAPSQNTTAQEENLNNDLNSLDNTNLDSGVDTGLNQVSSDSSGF